MGERDAVIPRPNQNDDAQAVAQEVAEQVTEQVQQSVTEQGEPKKELTQEEADIREKVFFEDDEKIRLRDGRTYYIPPLSLKDARKLLKLLNTIDSGVIIANLIPEGEDEEDRYDELMQVLLMAFKPYYKDMTVEYLEEYVDLDTAKKIIDCMIGLNGLKKSL